MINELLFGKLVKSTFGDKILFYDEKCIRSTGLKDKCQKCFDICPEAAIDVEKKSININNLLCSGCGKCVSVCPTSALNSVKNPYSAAFLRLSSDELTSSTWGCMKSTGKIDINFGCLRFVDKVYLEILKASQYTHMIKVDFSNCNGCIYNDNKEFAEIFGGEEVHSVRFEEMTNLNTNALNRREFLKGLMDKGNEYKDSTISDINASINEIIGKENYNEDIDEVNRVILGNLSIESINNIDVEKIFNLKFNNNCTFCKKCISYCPNDAIKTIKVENNEFIVYNVKKCNFCGICLERCEYKAIEKTKYTPSYEVKLVSKEIKKCVGCYNMTTDIDESGLCPTCRIREGNRKKFNLHRRKKID